MSNLSDATLEAVLWVVYIFGPGTKSRRPTSPAVCLGQGTTSRARTRKVGRRKERRASLSAGGRSYVGIDVSKATLDVAILPAREHFVVSNDEAGIDELLGKLLAEEVSDDALVVLEASGGFERPLVAALATSEEIA